MRHVSLIILSLLTFSCGPAPWGKVIITYSEIKTITNAWLASDLMTGIILIKTQSPTLTFALWTEVEFPGVTERMSRGYHHCEPNH